MGVPGFRPRGVASRFRGLLATAWRMARGAFFHFCICHIVSSFNSLRPWIRIADSARGRGRDDYETARGTPMAFTRLVIGFLEVPTGTYPHMTDHLHLV